MNKPFLLFSNGVLIDLEDSDFAINYTILCNPKQNKVELSHKTTQKRFSLPRMILNAPKELVVDHINRNGLDNRKENLRLATISQNCMNRIGTSKKGLPKGVYEDKRRPNRPYGVRVAIHKKYKYLGSYSNLQDAINAYNKAAAELHGEYHRPSSIDEEHVQEYLKNKGKKK